MLRVSEDNPAHTLFIAALPPFISKEPINNYHEVYETGNIERKQCEETGIS